MTESEANRNAGARPSVLAQARQVACRHWDERPPATVVSVLVVHAISLPPRVYGGDAVEALFCGRLEATGHPFFAGIAGLEVSAHLFIRRTGEVVQFVPFDKRAWHAGQSLFDGRTRVNDFSVGVELEGCDEDPFEDVQYQMLVDVAAELIHQFPAITPARIVGHAHIAPGRKTDPGPHFEWPRFRRQLGMRLAGPAVTP